MTPRQKKLLEAIINEFIESAEAVGSMNLLSKYGWDVSSATIRNEMAELMRQGYLKKPHTSAGRVPTTLAYKHFVEDIIEEESSGLEIALTSLIRQDLFKHRFNVDDLIYTALQDLVDQTGSVAMALIGGRVYHAGLSKVPTIPEYRQVQGLCNLIKLIEDRMTLKRILENDYHKDDKVRVLFGSDTNLAVFDGTVIIYSLVNLFDNVQGYIGVIGPERINYQKIVPTVDYIANTIEDVIRGWH